MIRRCPVLADGGLTEEDVEAVRILSLRLEVAQEVRIEKIANAGGFAGSTKPV